MNREILFRGKMVYNGKWIKGNIQVPKPPFEKWFMWDEDKIQQRVIPETVGQFIGRTDKHGTKIFEGDYLADRYTEDGVDYVTKLPVMWDNEKLCWSVDTSFAGDGSHSQPIADFFGDTELEVIGNIWDNPEKHGGDGN